MILFHNAVSNFGVTKFKLIGHSCHNELFMKDVGECITKC